MMNSKSELVKNASTRGFLRTLVVAAAVASAVVSGIAAAQQQGVLEEVVVTARMRTENLQEVPATVNAFTAEDIDQIGVTNMRDYAKLIPNFFLVETQNSSFTFVNIRGISQFRNTDPSVAIMVDGVLSTNPISMSQELYDIEQIEVLKGPQGALYGRSAVAGAISIRTKRPTNEVEAFIRGGVGIGDLTKMQGAISGPLVEDRVYGRLAVSYSDFDGVRDNIGNGQKADPHQNQSIRGRLIFEPSDTFEADFRFSHSQDEGTALVFTDTSAIVHETAPGSGISLGTQLGIYSCPGPTCGFVSAGPVTGGDRRFFDNPFNQPVPIGAGNVNNTSIPVQNNLAGIDEREISNLSALLTWEFDNGTLTSVTSFDQAENKARGEQPPRTPVNSQINSQYRDTETWSQEIRFTSSADQRLRWIAGAYFLDTDAFLSTTIQRDFFGVDTLSDFVTRNPLPQACVGSPLPPGNPNDNQGNCVMAFDGDGSDNFAWAVFAQLNYDITDNLELSVSIRHDEDDRDQIVETPNQFLPFASSASFGSVRNATFDSTQPKVTLRWLAQDNFMIYGTWSEGFRSGGFNRAGIRDRAEQLRPILGAGMVPLGINDVYDQQDTQSVEVGFKFNTADGRWVVNGAIFDTTVDNYHMFHFNPFLSASQIIIPVNEAELDGFELDVAVDITDGFSLSFGAGFTDSEITSDPARGLAGNWTPQTPEDSYNLGFNYVAPDGGFFGRLDMQRIGELYFVPENFIRRNELDLVNLRVGYNFGDDQSWQFAAWCANCTDENYFAEGFNPLGGFFYGRLRQGGVEITKRW